MLQMIQGLRYLDWQSSSSDWICRNTSSINRARMRLLCVDRRGFSVSRVFSFRIHLSSQPLPFTSIPSPRHQLAHLDNINSLTLTPNLSSSKQASPWTSKPTSTRSFSQYHHQRSHLSINATAITLVQPQRLPLYVALTSMPHLTFLSTSCAPKELRLSNETCDTTRSSNINTPQRHDLSPIATNTTPHAHRQQV